MPRKKENKVVIGVIGILLAVFGITGTIPLALKGSPYIYGLPITGLMVVTGVILIARAFSD